MCSVNIRLPQQNVNRSKREFGGPKLSVELDIIHTIFTFMNDLFKRLLFLSDNQLNRL